MDPILGGIISGGMNLLGGILGQRGQSAINTANIANQGVMNANAIQMRVADARAAGISPLAALGSTFAPSAATAVGTDSLASGVKGAGQDISRAMQAYGDTLSRSAQLDLELKRAQIDQINSTTAGEMLRNSKMATMSQPGTPPGLGVVDASGNVVKTIPPLTTDYRTPSGKRITLLSGPAQQSVFSGIPTMPLMPWIAAELGSANIPASNPMGSWSRYVPNFGNWDF